MYSNQSTALKIWPELQAHFIVKICLKFLVEVYAFAYCKNM